MLLDEGKSSVNIFLNYMKDQLIFFWGKCNWQFHSLPSRGGY